MGGIELGYRSPECVRRASVTWRYGLPSDRERRQGRAVPAAEPGGWLALATLAAPVYPWHVERLLEAAA